MDTLKRLKYLTLVPTNESNNNNNNNNNNKKVKYKELCSKMRDLIRSITKNSDDYDENYMKTKLNLDDDELPLNKTIEIPIMAIVVRAVFYVNGKYHPQIFLDECLYKI